MQCCLQVLYHHPAEKAGQGSTLRGAACMMLSACTFVLLARLCCPCS
jgi:hypothetical protein